MQNRSKTKSSGLAARRQVPRLRARSKVPRGSARTGFPLAVAPLERGPRRESPAPPHAAGMWRCRFGFRSRLSMRLSDRSRVLTVDRRPRRDTGAQERTGGARLSSAPHSLLSPSPSTVPDRGATAPFRPRPASISTERTTVKRFVFNRRFSIEPRYIADLCD